MEDVMLDILVIRCPKCNSSQTYYRLRSNTHRCKTCNYVWTDVEVENGSN